MKEWQNLNLPETNITEKEYIFHQKKMIGKNLRKIIEQFALNVLYAKRKNISCLCFKA